MTDHATGKVFAVDDLKAWYGESQALHGMNFDLGEGELVTLIGRNGAGKTTTLRSIMGIVKNRTGSIRFNGEDLINKRTFQIARAGIAYCPEERDIFSALTVSENLSLPPVLRPGGISDKDLLAQFPNLERRKGSMGTKLSGGEQQMLAIARILRTGSRFLLLDEPSEGLAPVVVKEIGQQLLKLKALGYTILLVEQNLRFAKSVADRHVLVENGRVVDVMTTDALEADMARVKSYLGV
ncbi:putative branched-chain amino acid transport system ATP-binding protein [Pseudooceanicola batsensis HTCC2597]|uniref:Putative branched-chain amino acid transport system ATP-binding protein n=1 Tax=Pseudooceanicola batsensis (strain ATCC BAA-863 / DSM 15984 / KCTC 12145 / HTCC2597) TaxID=252305 RepID=A3U156_PSEBH|nr:ABC transporter ATP-binding protein [Pseudooceanicola batsensis]EAQ02039.1 putative branched-chain amino acid transport system ATP-binding protein [Pseudooceanicola batsensis HTCC2597]